MVSMQVLQQLLPFFLSGSITVDYRGGGGERERERERDHKHGRMHTHTHTHTRARAHTHTHTHTHMHASTHVSTHCVRDCEMKITAATQTPELEDKEIRRKRTMTTNGQEESDCYSS